jgi:hypothetical protein
MKVRIPVTVLFLSHALAACALAGEPHSENNGALLRGEAHDARVTVAGSVDPTSRETIVKSFVREEMKPEGRAIALWQLIHTRMFHYANSGGDAWDMLCTYGCSLCGTMWNVTAWLANDPAALGPGNAGGGGLQKWFADAPEKHRTCKGWLVDSYLLGQRPLDAPPPTEGEGGMGGHTMGSFFFDGRSHFMDPMAGFYVYTADGDHIASLEEIASDPSLVTDPVKTSEPLMPCDGGAPHFFYRPRGGSGGKGKPIEAGPAHPINVKTGMQYVRYYGRTFPDAFKLPDQWQKSYDEAYWKDGPRHICDGGKGPRHFGNGEVVFEPAIGRNWTAALASSENVAGNLDGGIHAADPEKGFSFAVDFATPNIFPSGRVTGTAVGAGTVAVMPEGRNAKETVVWTGKAGETAALDLDLGAQLRGPCPRSFRLVFKMEKGARLERLRASGVFQYNYFMAPCLRPGENRVQVAWAGDARAVRVTWRWKEKGGELKEDVHSAAKSGEEYTIRVGELEPGRPATDPTFVESMIIEAE